MTLEETGTDNSVSGTSTLTLTVSSTNASITLKKGSSTPHITQIEITPLANAALQDPELTFTGITGNVTKELSEGSYSSVATTTSDAPIVYSSSNQEVATIDNGAVTLHATGTTVIKAEVAETETFNAASIQYTLTVIDPASMTTFVKVTNGTVTDGKYIIVYQERDDATSVVAMNNTNGGSYFECSNINLSEGKIITDNEAIIWDIARNENGTYTISNNGQFVNYMNDGTKINLSETMTDGKSTWNITSTSNNTFQIANSGTSSRLLRYNSNVSIVRFACYSNSGSEKNPTLYRVDTGKSDATISFNDIEGTTCEKMLTDGNYNSEATTTSDATIIYSSSNQEVATIEQDGVVTLLAGGTTVIKAEVAETETHTAASVEYTLRVIDPADIKTFEKVTDGSITDGQYILAYQSPDNANSVFVMSSTNTNDYFVANSINLTEGKITTYDQSIMWNITLESDGNYSISNNGIYVAYNGATSDSKNNNAYADAEYTSDRAGWIIEYDSNKNAYLFKNAKVNRRFLQCNPVKNSERFACYYDGSQQNITLYRLSDGKSNVMVTFNEVSGDKTLFFEEGLTYNSAATADPERPITYSSSNQEVATIDATGVVTLVGPGTTVIKATTEADDTYREGVAQYTLTVKASSVTLPYSTDFKSGLGDWISITTTGTAQWSSSQYGAQINAAGKGATEAYLISPKIEDENILLTFVNQKGFSGNDLQLLYSTDYNPNTMQPTEATWNDITDRASWGTSGAGWGTAVESGEIEFFDLTEPIRFAFKYLVPANEDAAGWQITDLAIQTAHKKIKLAFNNISNEKTLVFTEGFTYNSAATATPERPITYSSENQEVATIDTETGEVTLVGPGTTVISAATEGDEMYAAGLAQYTLTVLEASATLPYTIDFKSGFENWLTIATQGTTQWNSTQYGAQINGHGKGESEVYLISPEVTAENILLTFTTQTRFAGNNLQLLYSTDYNPNTMQPTEATWNDITDMASWGALGSDEWSSAVESGNVELYSLTSPIRFAFKYTCSNSEAAAWQVTDLSIQETTPKVVVTFDEVNGDKTLFFEEGLTYNSAATATPERPITYSSSNQEVATIDATGMVTLVGPGTTVIKATTEADDTYREGVAQYTLTVKASSVTLPYSTDFKSGLGDWISATTVGSALWTSDSQYGAKISGYINGKNTESEAYLISPAVTANNIILNFSSWFNYDGNALELLYSTDYDPNTMQPTDATWNNISENATWPTETFKWVESGDIELQDLTSPIRFAFRYTSTTDGASTWEITDLTIKEGLASGIATVEANGMKVINGKGEITIVTDTPASVAIYTLTGAQVRQIELAEGNNVVTLPAGIYVINRQKVVVF
ncbi:hypothetical protein BARVI_10170 [Barnesiella viscericola DSM 18177]|uniref:BIG2 domain-containing protein n=1 Tax=Barnesiella viscericola DSM 18177 TaxID=880074 RepID=W0ESW6_9BACT|nr:hypothetical protein BARVI_10170 [Barnesiella viscericola DSM 18177]